MKHFFSLVLMLIILFTFFNITIYAVEISAPHAILIDLDSGKMLFEKDAYSPTYPASTTKILTAILAFENCDLDEKVTASYTAVNSVYDGGTIASIQSGETLTVRELLSTLLVHSANDAAYILAEYIGGSTESFATMMNSRAKELGATCTFFVNPNGLPDSSHKCSAYDMAIFARYAMKNFPEFRDMVKMVSYSLPITPEYEALYKSENPSVATVEYRYPSTTTNYLINPSKANYYYEYATGIKTGYTSAAGNCLAASAEKDGVELIAVIFGAYGWDHLHEDIITLFEYGFSKLKSETLAVAGSVVDQVTIKNGIDDNNTLNIVVKDTLKATFSSTDYIEAFSPSIEIQKKLKAPIEEGDIVGKITYDIYNTTYTSNLVAGNSIKEKPTIIGETVKVTKNILGIVIKIVLYSLLAIVVTFIAIVLIRAYIITKKQRMRSYKRHMYNSRFR